MIARNSPLWLFAGGQKYLSESMPNIRFNEGSSRIKSECTFGAEEGEIQLKVPIIHQILPLERLQ